MGVVAAGARVECCRWVVWWTGTGRYSMGTGCDIRWDESVEGGVRPEKR